MVRLWQYVVYSAAATAVALTLALDSVPDRQPQHLAVYVASSKISVLVCFNMALCLVVLVANVARWFFFGALFHHERESLQARIIQYLLTKVIIVATLSDHSVGDLLVWASWFAAIGIVKIFSMIARDRSSSFHSAGVAQPTSVHVKILTVLTGVLLMDTMLSWFCVLAFGDLGVGTLSLMLFECVLVAIQTVHTLAKYALYFYDQARGGNWESKGKYMYYTLLWLFGVSFTLVDFVLLFHLRIVCWNLLRRWRSYKTYVAMERTLPDATREELEAFDDDCPICREHMESGKKLPCGHIFHISCIRRWLESNHSCPCCRYELRSTSSSSSPVPGGGAPDEHQPQPQPQQAPGIAAMGAGPRLRAAFGWLPGVRMAHERVPYLHHDVPSPQAQQSPLERHVAHVMDMFPQLDPEAVRVDLMRTRVLNATVENAMAGLIPLAIHRAHAVADRGHDDVGDDNGDDVSARTTAHNHYDIGERRTRRQRRPTSTTATSDGGSRVVVFGSGGGGGVDDNNDMDDHLLSTADMGVDVVSDVGSGDDYWDEDEDTCSVRGRDSSAGVVVVDDDDGDDETFEVSRVDDESARRHIVLQAALRRGFQE